MSQYGDVVSIQKLVWSDDYEFSGLFTGIRLVRMVLKQQIKSYIKIGPESTYVIYSGQRATCRHCGEYVHTGIRCIQNKKLIVQNASVHERIRSTKSISYSDVIWKAPARSSSTNSNTQSAEKPTTKNHSHNSESLTVVDTSTTKPAERDSANPQLDIFPFGSRESSSSSQRIGTTNASKLNDQQTQAMDFALDFNLPLFRVSHRIGSKETITDGKHKRDDDSGTDGSSVSHTGESRPSTMKEYYFLKAPRS